MILSNLKAALLRVADRLDKLNDPFEPLTRPAMPRSTQSLAEKAEAFERDLLGNFRMRGNTIFNYRIPQPIGTPQDNGDQALWHGVYTAMWAVRNKVQPEPWVEAQVTSCLIGLKDQQPGGILVRGLDESGKDTLDASNDQATGHLLGLYFAWKFGTAQQRVDAAAIMDEWAGNILRNNHALINPDGRPTTYGQLINGWKTDPLRATLAIAIYSAAHLMTGWRFYRDAFAKLFVQFHALIPYAKVKLWWLDTNYDTHRAAIHLAILQDTFRSELNMATFYGLARINSMLEKAGNIWVNALCGFGLRAWHPTHRDLALKILSEFDVERKQFNTGRENSKGSHEIRFFSHGDVITWKYETTIWNNQWVSRQPLPRWAVSAQDFFWQRNLYAIDFRNDGSPPDSRYNGGDYLAAYWLSRLNGTLNASD